MKKLTTILFATAMAVCIPQTMRAAENISMHDEHFIKKAAEGNAAEIQMGQMVSQRTQDPQVKAYADRLVRDHTQANQQLRQIAQAKGIELSAAPSHSEEREMKHLEDKSGAAFDRAVVDRWVKDHKKDIKEYDSEAKHTKDPQLQQYVQSTLPVLHDHLARAEALSSSKSTVHEPAGAASPRSADSAVHRGDYPPAGSGVHRGDYLNP